MSEQESVIVFEQPLDIKGREALGVWIKGMEKDDYINIRLEGASGYGPGYSFHVVNLDYSGWRYFTFCEQDNGDFADIVYRNDMGIGRNDLYLKWRERLDYDGIGALRILYTGDPSEIYMSDICAYPVDDSPVIRPSININGEELFFETALNPGSYIELKPEDNSASMYDIYGNKQEVSVSGVFPEILSGENIVRLNGEAGGVFRLKLHLVVRDEKEMWF